MNSSPFRFFALVGVVSLSATAHAGDLKVYPGANCHKYLGGGGGTPAEWWGTIQNQNADSDLIVVCPFVRDDDSQGHIASSGMLVLDRHPSLDVSCDMRMESVGWGGQVYVFSQNAHSSGYGNAETYVSFPDFYGLYFQYYYAFCSIPRAFSGTYSHIVYFSISEN